MIRAYCVDNEKDWGERIHLLLFASREVVQCQISSEALYQYRPRAQNYPNLNYFGFPSTIMVNGENGNF